MKKIRKIKIIEDAFKLENRPYGGYIPTDSIFTVIENKINEIIDLLNKKKV